MRILAAKEQEDVPDQTYPDDPGQCLIELLVDEPCHKSHDETAENAQECKESDADDGGDDPKENHEDIPSTVIFRFHDGVSPFL